MYVDGDVERLSKTGTFIGQHICVPLEGAAVHINAFNFPVWGMLEKLAPTLLAGMPAIVKPATATAYLTELVVRRIVESGILPEGALQLVCGSLGDLFDHLTCQDVVSFTGSASTAQKLRTHPTIVAQLGALHQRDRLAQLLRARPDAAPGQPEFDLFVREVVREMTAKAGQKCTAIRKAIVPAAHAEAVVAGAQGGVSAKIVVGDPRLEQVRMGPLAALAQRREVLGRIAELQARSRDAHRRAETLRAGGCGSREGRVRRAGAAVLSRAAKGKGGSQRRSVRAGVHGRAVRVGRAMRSRYARAARAAWSARSSRRTTHGRGRARARSRAAPRPLLVVNRDCAKESTGHGSPLPRLVHGGPGRAGGGEEMGGIRGVMHYMQRTAIQGSPQTDRASHRPLDARRRAEGRLACIRSANRSTSCRSATRLNSAEREVTLADIEKLRGALSGDTFYAHMDEEAARRNPLFGGRVAHGYFLVSAAAGLFVDPPYGPVLANYGIDRLRFLKPVKPGDRIKVRLTCKSKSLRAEKGYGEVAWDTEITNQNGEIVASYDVLTMVSEQPVNAVNVITPSSTEAKRRFIRSSA